MTNDDDLPTEVLPPADDSADPLAGLLGLLALGGAAVLRAIRSFHS